MNQVRACDYRGILARMAWVFQGLLKILKVATTPQRLQVAHLCIGAIKILKAFEVLQLCG